MKRKLICLFILALLLAISESQKRIYRRRPHFWIRPMMGLPGEPSSESENACVGECPLNAHLGDPCGNGCICLRLIGYLRPRRLVCV
uniref:TIL domain containing protein n=1 Tax=Rhipicephalus appendiculatus TaxID=34631 RepID=A0A131YFE0_RHIAP